MSVEALIQLFENAQVMRVIALLFVINLSITGIEVLLDLISRKQRRWQDSAANCAIFVANQMLELTVVSSIGFLGLLGFHWLTPLTIAMTGWTWAAALLAADFTYYWLHRMEHEHRILWASHSVHHSSQDYNLTVGFRLCLAEAFFEWIFLIPMVLIGFNPFQAIVALILVAQYQHWIHTERVGRMGWLDGLFNTPSVHRVHHGSNRQYLDKNYGGILMIWDRMFGTFERENEKVIYGLTNNINSNNPVTINIAEFRLLWQDVRRCRSLGDKLRMCVGGLSWRPDYFDRQR